MTEEAIASHQGRQKQLKEMREEMKRDLARRNPYDQSFQILDTDYDNFLILYNCQEIVQKVNKAGLSE